MRNLIKKRGKNKIFYAEIYVAIREVNDITRFAYFTRGITFLVHFKRVLSRPFNFTIYFSLEDLAKFLQLGRKIRQF